MNFPIFLAQLSALATHLRPAHQWRIVEGHHAVAQGGNQSQWPHRGIPMELDVFTWSNTMVAKKIDVMIYLCIYIISYMVAYNYVYNYIISYNYIYNVFIYLCICVVIIHGDYKNVILVAMMTK